MGQWFLAATALVFIAFGLWGLVSPLAMVDNFGVTLGGPDGATMIRASYGGFLIGEGALFAWCASSKDRQFFGLVSVVILTTPIFVSRAIGVLIDGAASPSHMAYLAIELTGIVLALLFLRKVTRP
jgi:hypothetical protein